MRAQSYYVSQYQVASLAGFLTTQLFDCLQSAKDGGTGTVVAIIECTDLYVSEFEKKAHFVQRPNFCF